MFGSYLNELKAGPFQVSDKTIGELNVRPQEKVYYSRKEDAISYWGGMTPSEKEELLRTVSCYGKEYSQGQECSHFTLTSGNRWEILSYCSK